MYTILEVSIRLDLYEALEVSGLILYLLDRICMCVCDCMCVCVCVCVCVYVCALLYVIPVLGVLLV